MSKYEKEVRVVAKVSEEMEMDDDELRDVGTSREDC